MRSLRCGKEFSPYSSGVDFAQVMESTHSQADAYGSDSEGPTPLPSQRSNAETALQLVEGGAGGIHGPPFSQHVDAGTGVTSSHPAFQQAEEKAERVEEGPQPPTHPAKHAPDGSNGRRESVAKMSYKAYKRNLAREAKYQRIGRRAAARTKALLSQSAPLQGSGLKTEELPAARGGYTARNPLKAPELCTVWAWRSCLPKGSAW
ncbi:hypothetical protein PTI98_005726 [Pleurotus ostreatus]|nr:hypothetical protein PTI98_005726 [Pleurotus ostreatus]